MEGATATTNGTSTETATVSNAAVESSSSNQQITELANNLLVQGRRHLLVTDIPAAIAALAESSRLMSELYGEFADECAEPYYYYGMALLEMARTDCDVLGDAVEGGDKAEAEGSSDEEEEENGDDEEESEEETEENKENGKPEGKQEADKSDTKEGTKESENKTNGTVDGEAKPEKAETNGTAAPETEKGKAEVSSAEEKKTEDAASSKETPSEKTEDVEMKEDVPENTTNGEATAEPTKSTEENGDKSATKPKNESKGKSLKPVGSSASKTAENGDEEDITDDVSNLQLAWEVFELAKKIYERKAETDPSAKPKLADALIRLAEVAIESENYASAIEDLRKCLEIQTTSFPADSRSLAETHYQLGVAYTFTTEFKEAVSSFEAAASVIQLRIENLKNPTEKKPSMEEPRNLFHTIEGEIEELETLLPDIREKIADTIDLEKEALRKLAENGTNGAGPSSSADPATSAGSEPLPTSTNGGSPDSNKPATDISHLIRKKRKPEDGVEGEASVAKKVCAEAVTTETA